MARYNTQLDDPEAVEEAYTAVETVREDYDSAELERAAGLLDDLHTEGEVPGCEGGTSTTLMLAHSALQNALDEAEQDDAPGTVRTELDRAYRTIRSEHRSMRDAFYQERRMV